MKDFKNILLSVVDSELSASEVVTILEILCTKIDINSISGMARGEGKTPRGIKISNNYRKFSIGDSLLCVKGLKDISDNLPF